MIKNIISRDKLLKEYAKKSIKDLAAKYNINGQSIRKYLAEDRNAYNKTTKQKINKRQREREQPFWDMARKLKRIPSVKEARNLKITDNHLYVRLKNELIQKGFKSASEVRHEQQRKHRLAELKNLARKLGHTPSIREVTRHTKVFGATYFELFGSMKAAQRLAGLKANRCGNSHEYAVRHGRFVSKQQCIDDLIKLREKLGHKPFVNDVKVHGAWGKDTYKARLGNEIKDYIEIRQKRQRQPLRITPELREQMITHLKNLAARLGRTPGMADVNADKTYIYLHYLNCFGSLSKAQLIAGLEPRKRNKRLPGTKEEKKAMLLAHLKSAAKKLGRAPLLRELTKDAKYDISSYNYYFGSYYNAQRQAGLKMTRRRKSKAD